MAIKRGTAGSDLLNGTSLSDDLYGLGGSDTLKGLGGNDRLWGGSGIDAIFAGDGADQVYGEAGDDYLDSGSGNDFVHGGSGSDRLRGGDGDDRLVGGPGDDDVRGGNGNDTIIHEISGLVTPERNLYLGDAGVDTLMINAGGATIGHPGSPTVSATAYISVDPNGTAGEVGFDDRQPGETGLTIATKIGEISGIETFTVSPDTRLDFFGGALNATVTGGNQHDRFFSGSGSETFNGAGGPDEFNFGVPGGPADVDRLVGFNAAEDVIVTGMWEDSQGTDIRDRTITESGGHTFVRTYDDGQLVHTMDIDAVGIPLDVFKDVFSWG